MAGTVVNEPLNPTAWTVEQQQAIYDELAVILGVNPTPPPNLPDMTDQELTELLHATVDEIKTRPTAVGTLMLNTAFNGDDIVEQEEAAASAIQRRIKNG